MGRHDTGPVPRPQRAGVGMQGTLLLGSLPSSHQETGPPMILTTTDTVDGKRVVAYLGVVSADVVLGSNMFKDFFASVRDWVGGRVASYEKVFADAKREAMEDLAARAKELGADAVIGIDLDYQTVGGDNKTLLMVAANGTAVKLG
jgi:uncharacterized protein YbjQ (UPF0145 family)